MSLCAAPTPTGPCGRPYIEHGPVPHTHGSITAPISMAPPSSAWSHPTNPVFPNANAARVDHFTAAREAGIPAGPFNNSSTRRIRAQTRSNSRGFTQGTPALATNSSVIATFLSLRIMFLPFAVHL